MRRKPKLPAMPPTPASDWALSAASDVDLLTRFIAHLRDRGCLVHAAVVDEAVIDQFLGIDRDRIEKERSALVAWAAELERLELEANQQRRKKRR